MKLARARPHRAQRSFPAARSNEISPSFAMRLRGSISAVWPQPWQSTQRCRRARKASVKLLIGPAYSRTVRTI
jgi:hypothetical protein